MFSLVSSTPHYPLVWRPRPPQPPESKENNKCVLVPQEVQTLPQTTSYLATRQSDSLGKCVWTGHMHTDAHTRVRGNRLFPEMKTHRV